MVIVSKIPGKLFIAGEYAVVEPGNTAILVAVDKFITVSLKEADKMGSIRIYEDYVIHWIRDNGKIILEKEDPNLNYILSAINIVEKYVNELGKRLSYYDIKVSSELETKDRIKYGLGSSAAVTVATVDALCNYFEIKITEEELFKLSALASLLVNNRSSCGDIASCVYGGWIAYTTFSRDWVLKKMRDITVSELIKLQWPSFKVEKLSQPKDLNLVVGWTGVPSSTRNLVESVNNKISNNSHVYEKFLNESNNCVKKIISAFKDNNVEEVQRQIQKNRELLIELSKQFNIQIETPKLTKLCDIALKYNGSAKPSGAGGGDCGIAILKGNNTIDVIKSEWEKSGIAYLPIQVYYKKGDES